MTKSKKAAVLSQSSKPFAAEESVRAVVRRADGSYHVSLKISDPSARRDVKALQDKVTRSPKVATAFLRDAGILTATGKLTKRFGG